MSKKLLIYEGLGLLFSLLCGLFLHYTYALSGENAIVSFFSATNESVWEHLKLLFFPAFLYTAIEYFYIGKRYSGFIITKALAVLIGLLFTTAAYYTYSGAIGKNIGLVNILIFVFSCLVCYGFSYFKLLNNSPRTKYANAYGAAILVLLTFLFVLFTLTPPEIPLFGF